MCARTSHVAATAAAAKTALAVVVTAVPNQDAKLADVTVCARTFRAAVTAAVAKTALAATMDAPWKQMSGAGREVPVRAGQ